MIEWHRGDLSSYDLLFMLEFMDDRGAFKTALRGGEYSEEEITWRHVANEIARLRATMHAVHGGQRYDPPTLHTRAEQVEMAEQAEATEERREEFYSFAEMDGPAGFGEVQPPLDPLEVWDFDEGNDDEREAS